MACLDAHEPEDLLVLIYGKHDLKTCFHLPAENIAQ